MAVGRKRETGLVSLLPTDPYGIFFRRIGYSVGLEETAARVRDLEALYLAKRDVTIGMWDHLVHSAECWGLKSAHIADVFYSLGLVWRTGTDIVILENLDAMAISSELSDDGEAAERGRSFLLLWAILANDGEIFVNLLMAGFERERCRQRLTLLVKKKRRFLRERIPGVRAVDRFLRAVSIERQASNPGSARRRGQPVYPGGGRTSIVAGSRRVPWRELYSGEISDDYLRKVPGRRMAWACSLGLWEARGGITRRGESFIEGLTCSRYIGADGVFVFWPMEYELIRSRLRPDLLGETKGLWESVVDAGRAYAALDVAEPTGENGDRGVATLAEMMKVYRSLNSRKALLRQEMPVTIAFPAICALAIGRREPVLDLPHLLERERMGRERRVAVRPSRYSGQSLSLRSR